MLSRDFKKLLKGKKAFTLIEVMIVIAIITVMTGFIAPSATVMRERGRQINRMNIARTIYLSMQNQLTKEMVGGSLKTILTGPFYETDENGFFTDRLADGAININNVAQALSANLDQDINDVLPPNEDITLVRFISKPRNYDPFAEANEGNVLLNNFFNLLSEIILDREILNDAILMEYNISTGVVLSIFYGDDAEQTLLTYMDIDDNDRNNVTGGRGVNNYWQASERRQGYYGVDSTGVLPPVRNIEQANIYDGIETGRDLDGRVNVLYAEFLLEAQDVYTFEVLSGDTSILTITMNPDITPFPTDFANALLVNNGNIIFQPGMQGDLFRYIWVIDFTDGNINQPNSVGERIRGDESPINLGDIDTVGEDGRIDFPSQVRVRASRDGNAGVTSRTSANLFYDREINGNYEIRTARHLNNVRYLPDRIFRQTEDIDMARPWGNVMNNFAPIRNFSGRYSAMSGTSSQFRIENLRIDIPDTTENRTNFGNNIGLFADPSGDIQGIALFAATINARYPANVGAIAGQLASGGRIRQSYSYANIDASNGNGNSNTGGLVGHIVNNGSLEQSFNAGFYNTATSTETENDAVRGSVMADRGNIGGLVGWNDGLIHNSFNNARVNTTDVELVGMLGSLSTEPVYRLIDGVNYGGIAGRNSGIIRNTYATNFVPFIPLEESVLRNIRSGGIAGRDDGTLIDNFYITNGNRDQGSRPKTDLMEELLWANSAFRRGQVYIEGTNTYLAYPYPILRSNNPFPFILPAELWGYEDIEDFEDDFIFGNLEFSYYERYDDGNFSFSPGGTIPLATDGIVTNDGYVLEFNFTQAMGLSINGISFELNAGENLANWTSGVDLDWNWEWTPINGTQVPLNKPVQVGEIVILDDDGNEIIVPNFRMFFENNFLEEFANGAEFINFSIINPQTNAVFREFSFNPLFADTINRTFHTIDDEDYNFVVRSPRHAANIGLAPASTFVQTLDIDFGLYFRTLIAGRTFGELIYIDLTSQPVFVNSAVINTPFLGDYNGNGHEIRNVVANNGLFHIVGDNARVRRITLRDATITYSPLIGGGPIGGIAAINFGLIELSAVIDSLISSGTAGGENIKVGGIVG
ncbi:MAG: type II secretion system GspH family protein, partial [Lachnospiraceae bacterium]|nr:type II secretion system GspH family protein [Lachnospiraceae bacterium]